MNVAITLAILHSANLAKIYRLLFALSPRELRNLASMTRSGDLDDVLRAIR